MTGLFRDTLRGLRSWHRTPGSAFLVILALGLSGGALLTLVNLFNALFWRELPVRHPDELVSVVGVDPRAPDSTSGAVPLSLFAALERTQTAFQAFAGFEREESTAVIENLNQRVAINGVTGRYFETLGVRPALGQLIGPREVDSVAPVATISFRCWQTRFGADPSVIGRTFRLQGELVSVIGVAPRAFTGLEIGMPTDVWVPESLTPRLFNWSPRLAFVTVFGRLRQGATLQLARSQIESLWPGARDVGSADVGAAFGKGKNDDVLAMQPRVESATRGFSASGYRMFYRRTLTLLIVFSVITILLACANLSGLLLARWTTREIDLAVQAALGASNGRLVLQVIGESLTLSIIAVLLSAPLALWSAKGLTVLLWNQPDASVPLDLSPDYRVLAVMALLISIVALSVSLLPAFRIWSAKLKLISGTRGLPGHSVTRAGRWLVAAQVALSVPLLVTAWIVAMNLHRLERVPAGFHPDGVIAASLIPQSGSASLTDPVAYLTQLVTALRADPGIDAAALSWSEPLSISAEYRRRPVTTDDGLHTARSFVMPQSPGCFETLGVALVAGRDFDWTDDRRQHDVAVLSAELARVLFPDITPIGRRVRLGGQPDRDLEVIGVVGDARLAEPHASNQQLLFTALLQEPVQALALQPPYLLFKSPLPSKTVEAQARRTILGLGRHDIVDAHPVQRTLESALLRERAMRLGAFYFAGLTILLVFVGLYAVLSFGVSKRIPEIGLRIALGASAHDIRAMVIREALVTAVVGLAVGIPCAFWSGRLIAGTLTTVGSHDVLGFAVAIVVILAISMGSVLIPVRRATRVTPSQALIAN